MEKQFIKIILLSVILSLFISSCGLLKKRTVSVDILKSEQKTTQTVEIDSSNNIVSKETLNYGSINNYDNEIIIETDTGIVVIDPAKGFIGKAKKVYIKSKGQLKDTLNKSTETNTNEKLVKKEKKEQAIKTKEKVKDTKSEVNYYALAFFIAIALVALYLFKKFRNFNS